MASSGTTREFSLHLETISPVDDFVQVEENISANATQPVCWSAQVASWVTPQPLVAHVWAYDQKTFPRHSSRVAWRTQRVLYAVLGPRERNVESCRHPWHARGGRWIGRVGLNEVLFPPTATLGRTHGTGKWLPALQLGLSWIVKVPL